MLKSPIFYLNGCLQLPRKGGRVAMNNPALLLGVEADAWGVGVICPRPLRSSATSPVPSPSSHSFITPSCGSRCLCSTFSYGISNTCSTCLPPYLKAENCSRVLCSHCGCSGSVVGCRNKWVLKTRKRQHSNDSCPVLPARGAQVIYLPLMTTLWLKVHSQAPSWTSFVRHCKKDRMSFATISKAFTRLLCT